MNNFMGISKLSAADWAKKKSRHVNFTRFFFQTQLVPKISIEMPNKLI